MYNRYIESISSKNIKQARNAHDEKGSAEISKTEDGSLVSDKLIKRHLQFAADDNFKFCCFSKITNKADNSHEISYPIFRKDVTKFAVCCSRDWRF